MPPGITPPLILNYSASTVPILQLATSSKTLSEQQVLDLTQNFIRPALGSIPGAAIPYAYGGRVREVQIDLNPQALQAKGLSAQDVENAIAAQDQILPGGTVKIGVSQYTIKSTDLGLAETIDELNDLPIKSGERRDHLHPRRRPRPRRLAAATEHRSRRRLARGADHHMKAGSASTLAIVQGVKDALPKLKETLPADFGSWRSTTSRCSSRRPFPAWSGRGLIAAALTSLMILLFLGSWRSTVIIATSIPLAILSALACLSVAGQT